MSVPSCDSASYPGQEGSRVHLTLSYSRQGRSEVRPRRRALTVAVAMATILGTAVAMATWLGWSPFTG